MSLTAHGIILGKNAALGKMSADAAVGLTEIHEAIEALPQNNATRSQALVALDNFADFVTDATSDIEGQLNALKTMLGI